ncbi:MAG: gliding motility-associated C-terminal domain-containing protein [Crocinitomicaceae bacterium]|nr:gliding motility-associated C-terminal domain-containing protein [Crocinitomicaceae bacterium]
MCTDFYSEENASFGNGNIFEQTGICNLGSEVSSMWYTFTVEQTGMLSFIIDPNNDYDDYDWGLFNVTNGGCTGLGTSSPEVSCNSWGSPPDGLGNPTYQGSTGISTANGGSGSSNGPNDYNGPPFNADFFVTEGQTFALVVMNWSQSPYGYSIDFSGSSASLYDDIPPVLLSAELNCGNTGLVAIFDEPVQTTSVQTLDFSITGPGGTYSVSSAMPETTGAAEDDHIVVALDGQITVPGTYTITITNFAGMVEDACGNVGGNTITVEVIVPLMYNLIVTPSCNGVNGEIEVANITGGQSPYVFRLNNAVQPDLVVEGLQDGNYTVNVTDALNCSVTLTTQLPDHQFVIQLPEQDSISCSLPKFAIEGLLVEPQQETTFSWSTGETGSIESGSTTSTPVVNAPGQYIVTVTNTSNGCSVISTVNVYPGEEQELDLSSMQLPNVVTPNGDKKNDLWQPYLKSDPEFDLPAYFDTFQLNIFNRWGTQVYQSEETKRFWNGSDVEGGTYFYIFEYGSECGSKVSGVAEGFIELIK